MSNCPICNIEFSKSRWNQIYCSIKCKRKSRNVNSVLKCVICGTEFNNLGHTTTCSIECSKQNKIEWKKKRLADQNGYSRTPEAKAKRKILESTPEWKEKHRIYNRLRYQNNPDVRDKISSDKKEKTIQIKLDVFTHYSKEISNSDVPICACCKIDDIRFLTLDHIEGRKHLPKKEQKLVSLNLWRHVKKTGLPTGYQVLCYNCNIAKGTSHFCPHEIDRMEDDIRKEMKKISP